MDRRDDLFARQGASFAYGWPILDAEGEPQDMSAWAVQSQIRAYYGESAPLLAELTGTGRADGLVVIEATAADTLLWSWGKGVYDVIATSPSGLVGWVGGGSIRVQGRVTR